MQSFAPGVMLHRYLAVSSGRSRETLAAAYGDSTPCSSSRCSAAVDTSGGRPAPSCRIDNRPSAGHDRMRERLEVKVLLTLSCFRYRTRSQQEKHFEQRSAQHCVRCLFRAAGRLSSDRAEAATKQEGTCGAALETALATAAPCAATARASAMSSAVAHPVAGGRLPPALASARRKSAH